MTFWGILKDHRWSAWLYMGTRDDVTVWNSLGAAGPTLKPIVKFLVEIDLMFAALFLVLWAIGKVTGWEDKSGIMTPTGGKDG
mgnify:CR=1 FL=1